MKSCLGFWAVFLFLPLVGFAQPAQPASEVLSNPKPDTLTVQRQPHLQDVADLAHRWFPRLPITPHDSATLREGGRFVLVLPQLGYTLQTRFLAAILVNTAFRKPGANMSSMTGMLSYTQNKQVILAINSAVWSTGNRFLTLSDWRVMHYPQATYGLGMYTSTETRVVNMDYAYFRFYQSVLRRLAPNFYGGAGYYVDLHWNIQSFNRSHEVTRISRYSEGVAGRSVSSGPGLQLLYDSRRNAINPAGGLYVNTVFRANMDWLGSDNTYQSLLLEARKYIPLSRKSGNILAFWSYNSLTLSGNPPFLDLPSTGWDSNGNVGRGYIQGRFRGKNLLYAEAAYRFHLTADRLLGAVVFANLQSVSELTSKQFEKVAPGVGAGLRIKMNKISRANLSIDYGFGMDGSHGLFFNLGEVF